jgi:hypothetical protein
MKSIPYYIKWAITTKPNDFHGEFSGDDYYFYPDAPFFSKPGFFRWATWLWLVFAAVGVFYNGSISTYIGIGITFFGLIWFTRAGWKMEHDWFKDNYVVNIHKKGDSSE